MEKQSTKQKGSRVGNEQVRVSTTTDGGKTNIEIRVYALTSRMSRKETATKEATEETS